MRRVFLLVFLASAFGLIPKCTLGQDCYNCYEYTGNMCLASCGFYAQSQYDNAAPYTEGPYCGAGALYPDCSATCGGHGIGVDYSDYKGYPCYDNCETVNPDSVAVLEHVVPGAPIFTTNCSGSLVAIQQSPPAEQPKLFASRRLHLSFDEKKGGGL